MELARVGGAWQAACSRALRKCPCKVLTARVGHHQEVWPSFNSNFSWSGALRASNALIIRAIRSLRA